MPIRNRPSTALLRVVDLWRSYQGDTDKIANELGISKYGVYSNYKRLREHYECHTMDEVLDQARTLGHLPESDHILCLQQIVRSLLCHDPETPTLLNEYYAKYGRGLLEVPRVQG